MMLTLKTPGSQAVHHEKSNPATRKDLRCSNGLKLTRRKSQKQKSLPDKGINVH